MKKAMFFAGAFAALIGIFSCSDEAVSMDRKETNVIHQLSNDQYNALWSTLKLGNQSVLFTYTNTGEAKQNGIAAMLGLQSDLQSEMKLKKGCTRVQANVKLSGGYGTLISYQFIDDNKKLVLETHTLNQSTGTYTVTTGGSPADELGYCPDGWQSLANCPHFLAADDFASCLGTAQGQFTNNNLAQVGDCIEFRIQVGSAATSMCGRTC